MAMHHWRKGWYFIRNDDGSVLITVPNGDPANLILESIPANEWASIVAAVSKDGETGERFREALRFHNGEAQDA